MGDLDRRSFLEHVAMHRPGVWRTNNSNRALQLLWAPGRCDQV